MIFKEAEYCLFIEANYSKIFIDIYGLSNIYIDIYTDFSPINGTCKQINF